MTKAGWWMISRERLAGYVLLLLALSLQDWTPLLLYVLGMLGRDHLRARRQLERGE